MIPDEIKINVIMQNVFNLDNRAFDVNKGDATLAFLEKSNQYSETPQKI